MTETKVLLDPTSERTAPLRKRIAPPRSLDGLTIGLLDISKPRGDVFLDRLEERLAARGLRVRRYRKPTVARKAPEEITEAIASECDLLIEALAD
jgi:hypothetical protein